MTLCIEFFCIKTLELLCVAAPAQGLEADFAGGAAGLGGLGFVRPVRHWELRLWWYPPGARLLYTQAPASAHAFFQRPFFLWMPYRMWAFPLKCPACGSTLTGAGLYNTVRRVLDKDEWYFMATEYLECCSCGKKVVSWSHYIWVSWTSPTGSSFQLFSHTSKPKRIKPLQYL